jgi:hypothetical protein
MKNYTVSSFLYCLLVTFIADAHITFRLISPFPFVLHQIYAVSITIRIVVSVTLQFSFGFSLKIKVLFLQFNITLILQLGFLLIALIWKFDFAPFMVLIIAVLNDGMYSSFSH